jgi:hypothetical protein
MKAQTHAHHQFYLSKLSVIDPPWVWEGEGGVRYILAFSIIVFLQGILCIFFPSCTYIYLGLRSSDEYKTRKTSVLERDLGILNLYVLVCLYWFFLSFFLWVPTADVRCPGCIACWIRMGLIFFYHRHDTYQKQKRPEPWKKFIKFMP